MPEEAAVVRRIFQNFLDGKSRLETEREFASEGITTREGYPKRYDGLVRRYDEAKARYDEVAAAISAKEAQSERLSDFIKVLKSQDGTISDFDGSLWGGMVEFVTVDRDKGITVTFRDGTEILA